MLHNLCKLHNVMQICCVNMLRNAICYVIDHIPSNDKDKACLSVPLAKFQLQNFRYCSIQHPKSWYISDELLL